MSTQTDTAPETTMQQLGQGDSFNIPQHTILQGIARYAAEDQEDLLWLAGYIRDRLGNSRREAQAALNADWSTIIRILAGKYSASIANFMDSVRHLKRKAEAAMDRTEFVETIVTRKIFAACDLAKNMNAVVHICGGTGRSKTHAVREWQRRNNHGRAIYVDVPVLGGVYALMHEIATRTNVSVKRRGNDLIHSLLNSFDHRHTIILDEATRLMNQGRFARDVKALEFVRRLHDVRGVGLVFVSTDVFRREMESGALSDYLEQFVGRIEEPLRIPEKVSMQEAGEICRHFNPEADIELIRLAAKVANDRGRVRNLFRLLRQALLLARAKREALSVAHLKAAVALRENAHRWPEE